MCQPSASGLVSRSDCRTVGDIRLLHLPLVAKGWIHSFLHIWLRQRVHTKRICSPFRPVYRLLLFMHRAGKTSGYVCSLPPDPRQTLWLGQCLQSPLPRNSSNAGWNSRVKNWFLRYVGMSHRPTHTCRQSCRHCWSVSLQWKHAWLSLRPILANCSVGSLALRELSRDLKCQGGHPLGCWRVVGKGSLGSHLVELLAKGVTGQNTEHMELLQNSNSELNVCYVQLFYVIQTLCLLS